jgi:hypothetical protein
MAINKGRGPRKKIVRVAEKYQLNLEEIGKDMAQKWTAPDDEQRHTLNELRDQFNRQILREAMEANGMEPVPGEVEYGYKYLFDDDTPHSDEMDVRNRLEDNGVDVDQVIEDFINSPQTIHNYLRQVEDVELREESGDDRSKNEKSRDHLKSLDRRYEKIVASMIDTLIEEGEYPDHDYNITVECFVEDMETGKEEHISEILSTE